MVKLSDRCVPSWSVSIDWSISLYCKDQSIWLYVYYVQGQVIFPMLFVTDLQKKLPGET